MGAAPQGSLSPPQASSVLPGSRVHAHSVPVHLARRLQRHQTTRRQPWRPVIYRHVFVRIMLVFLREDRYAQFIATHTPAMPSPAGTVFLCKFVAPRLR